MTAQPRVMQRHRLGQLLHQRADPGGGVTEELGHVGHFQPEIDRAGVVADFAAAHLQRAPENFGGVKLVGAAEAGIDEQRFIARPNLAVGGGRRFIA